MSNRLTINLGLRYEYNPWLKGYRGQVATFDPTQAKSIIVASDTDKIDLDAQPLAKVGYQLYRRSDSDQQPGGAAVRISPSTRQTDGLRARVRLAALWRPDGDSRRLWDLLRVRRDQRAAELQLSAVQPQRNGDCRDHAVPTRTLGDFYLGVPFGTAVGTVGWVPLPLEAKAGRDQRWNVGFQQELFPLTTLEVNYVGTTGAHQQQAENINPPPAGPGSVQTRRPYPRFGDLSVNTQAMSSRYHALQTKLQKRCRRLYLVSYLLVEPADSAGAGNRWQLRV